MLSLAECKKTLNNGNRKFSDEETAAIRELLYKLAEIDKENFQKTLNEEESSIISKSVDH